MIQIIKSSDKKRITAIKERSDADFDAVLNRVIPILQDVRRNRDSAVLSYTKKFDGVNLTSKTLRVTKSEIKAAYKKVDKKTITALKKAAKNIERYAKLQLPKSWKKQVEAGISVGQVVRPLDRVGCYVPGGNFPLPSTVLMNCIPAKVAGVSEIVVCTPPGINNSSVLIACDLVGVTEIYKVGGAQAIGAMAYGTETIAKVNKIVGPGNIYVTAAKKLVYGDVGIDFIAGPSEIAIVAEKMDASFIAADMLSQAEHDKFASSILITTKKKLAEQVKKELMVQIEGLLTKENAKKSLYNYGAIIIAKNIDEAFEIVNDLAPEHLEIENPQWLSKVKNAGAIFLGLYSVEAAGDYCSGPNHVLPTRGFAKARAGLSVLDFVKMPTIQQLTKKGLKKLIGTIKTIADLEGLEAHKKSAEIRFK